VLRQDHKAGEKMFVDWAGATIPVFDGTTGQAWPASLFVSVLGASSYAYAEATRDQQLQAWIQVHIHALEFYGGAPTLIVPDNTKTGTCLGPSRRQLASPLGSTRSHRGSGYR
jgi:transposase